MYVCILSPGRAPRVPLYLGGTPTRGRAGPCERAQNRHARYDTGRSTVGELVELASVRGRKVNKKLKLGICGEHGGDPKSIEFCSRTGLNYVSCSPFRVPVARLAAAQAELRR